MQGPKTHPTLQSHIDVQAPLQNALLLGPLPLLIPPTHPSTSSLSHTLTHLSSLLSTTSLLRSLPLNTSKRLTTLPRELAVKHGLVDEDLFRNGAAAQGLQDVCFEIGTRGMDELITARSHLRASHGKIDPSAATPVFLSAVSWSSHSLTPNPADYLQRRRKGPGGTVLETSRSGGFQPVPSGSAKGGLEARAEHLVHRMDVKVVTKKNTYTSKFVCLQPSSRS